MERATTDTSCLRSSRSAALNRAALTVRMVRMSCSTGETAAAPPTPGRRRPIASASVKTPGARLAKACRPGLGMGMTRGSPVATLPSS